jgi:CubicO group peptidase (beta-lactamase class C family)
MSRFTTWLCGVLLAASSGASVAQALAPPDVDPYTLARRSRASWSQAEREYAFSHWDRLFEARTIKRGEQVRALPAGAPLASFEPGGEGARQLQRNIDEFKVAGIVVLHDGKIRLERYALGHAASGRWVSFSMAKSVTSTLVGAAIKDGAIASVDDAVTRYIPELRGSAYDGVTLRQVLTMSSGAKWNEDYSDPAADVALFYSMPIEPGLDATVSYMKKLVRATPPGEKWHYNTGESNLIGVVVARATKKDLASYASEKIWARYGMEQDATWMVDRTGNVHGGCCIAATTRDYARLGQFILEGARIAGQAIVADGWLEAATRKQIDIGQPGVGYGYQWWTRDYGIFNAVGIHGQLIHIDPSRRLVITINSVTPEAVLTKDALAARIALFEAIRAAIDAEGRGGAGKQ